MINILPEYVKAYCIREIDDSIEWIGGEYVLEIDDVDDLHDCTIESIEVDAVYYAMYSLLPVVLDDCIDYANDAQDDWDPWREYYRNVFN